MKLVTFRNPVGQRRIGAMVDDGDRALVVDLNHAYGAYAAANGEGRPQALADARVPADMRALFEGGDPSLDAARAAIAHVDHHGLSLGLDEARLLFTRDEVRLCAPIVPTKLVHTSGNFKEHIDELAAADFAHIHPWIVFYQNVDAIIGPDEPIVYPTHMTSELDYELELAAVLKSGGADMTAEEAEACIGGFVIFNDITARDIQRREMKSSNFSFSKALQTFCPLGPWIVTTDEIEDPHDLEMLLRVNGEQRQVSSTRNLSVTIPEIIAHYSAMGYRPGDIVTTGTVSGVAALSPDPGAWLLRPGDVVECEIEGIGVLRNPVVDGAKVRAEAGGAPR